MKIKRLRYKVVKIENVVEVWMKLGKYISRVQDFDKHTEKYTSSHLVCDSCGQQEYHKDDLLYLDLLKNKGYCMKCILKRGLNGNDIERDKKRFRQKEN